MGRTQKIITFTAYSFSSLRSHLCARRTTEVAPLPIATRSQVPYFFKRPTLSPAADFGPPSESDFLLLAEERADDLRESLGADPRRSLRVNLWPPSLEWTEGGPLERGTGLASTGVTGTARSFLDPLGRTGDSNSDDRSGLAPDMLGALLGAWLGGRLGGAVGGGLHRLLSDGEGELVGDGVVDVVVERETPT
jgi:hypothetical protein